MIPQAPSDSRPLSHYFRARGPTSFIRPVQKLGATSLPLGAFSQRTQHFLNHPRGVPSSPARPALGRG